MAARMMTEAEAWREVARRIVEGEWKKVGLCYEVWQVWGHDNAKLPYLTLLTMKRRIEEYLGKPGAWGWAYPEGKEPEARALAALWMAHEAETEST